MTELVRTNLSDQMAYAQAIVTQPERGSTSLLPQAYRGNPANVLIAMGLGQALDLTPAQSLYEIYVVNGRPSPSANLMAGLVRKAGHKLRIDGDATRCTATLIRRDDPEAPFTATWTIEQARAAGLAGKDTWKQYPGAMLRARAVSEVVRMGASECVLGMDYSAEEMRDVETDAPAPAAVKSPGLAGLRAAVQQPEPVADVTDAEVLEDEPKMTERTRGAVFALMTEAGLSDPKEQRAFLTDTLGRGVASRSSLTESEGLTVEKRLRAWKAGDADAAWVAKATDA